MYKVKYSKGLMLFAVLMVLSVFSVAQAEEETPENIQGTTRVNADEVINLVESMPDLTIIDARKTSDREKGYIEGSIGLPDTETDEDALAMHITGKDTPVLFYCNGVKCGRSVKSAKLAVSLGYSKVYWFRGGWAEWVENGLPVTK